MLHINGGGHNSWGQLGNLNSSPSPTDPFLAMKILYEFLSNLFHIFKEDCEHGWIIFCLIPHVLIKFKIRPEWLIFGKPAFMKVIRKCEVLHSFSYLCVIYALRMLEKKKK